MQKLPPIKLPASPCAGTCRTKAAITGHHVNRLFGNSPNAVTKLTQVNKGLAHFLSGLATLEEALQLVRTRRMTQLAQGLGFDLADTFTGDVELFADFFQRMIR